MREDPSIGLTCIGEFPKMGINRNNLVYISPMCPEALRGRICTQFGTAQLLGSPVTNVLVIG